MKLLFSPAASPFHMGPQADRCVKNISDPLCCVCGVGVIVIVGTHAVFGKNKLWMQFVRNYAMGNRCDCHDSYVDTQ